MGRPQQFFCLQNQTGRGFPQWEADLGDNRVSADIKTPIWQSPVRQEASREAGPVRRSCRLRDRYPLVTLLTLWEAGWVVVDVSNHDGDCSGAREATQLACHVRGLDNHLVAFLALTVEVRHGCPDHTYGQGRVGTWWQTLARPKHTSAMLGSVLTVKRETCAQVTCGVVV